MQFANTMITIRGKMDKTIHQEVSTGFREKVETLCGQFHNTYEYVNMAGEKRKKVNCFECLNILNLSQDRIMQIKPNTKQSEGKTMNTKDLSMSQRDKLKSALNSINWSNGRGSIVGIGYTESEVGYFFRKFQYGNDKIKYRIEERVNGIFAHCLNRTKKI